MHHSPSPRKLWLILGSLNLFVIAVLALILVLLNRGNRNADEPPETELRASAVPSLILPAASAPPPSPIPSPSIPESVPLVRPVATPSTKPVIEVKVDLARRFHPTPKGITREDGPLEPIRTKSGVTLARAKATRGWVVARPAEHPGVDAKKVDEAIQRGMHFLKKNAQHEVLLGSKALAGLALLHSDVPVADAVVQVLAQEVRTHAGRRTSPYDLAPCIWFLDRLGDKRDVPLIRSLALRLIASQQWNGGWGYTTQILTPDQERTLLKLLMGDPFMAGKAGAAARTPPDLAWVSVLRYVPGKGMPRPDPKTGLTLLNRSDNSATQFGVLGLWVARRHGIPAERSLLLAEERFRLSQELDGGWSYINPHDKTTIIIAPKGGVVRYRDTATCAGLLSLASASALRKPGEEADVGIEKAFHYLAGQLETYRLAHPDMRRVKAAQLATLYGGQRVLMNMIGGGDGFKLDKGGFDLGKLMKVGDMGAGGIGGLGGVDIPHRGAWFGADAWGDLYYLWSLERVATVYDLKTIGKFDWYGWGAPIILDCQEKDGSWREAFPPVPDTAFALLFLRRANLFLDLAQAVDAGGLAKGVGVRDLQPNGVAPGQTSKVAHSVFAGRAIGPGVEE